MEGGEAPKAQEPEATLEDMPAAIPMEVTEKGDGAADTNMIAMQGTWDPWPTPAQDTTPMPAQDAPTTPQDDPAPAQEE